MLKNNGKSLKDYPSMPFPNGFEEIKRHNHLILGKLTYDKIAMKVKHENLLSSMTHEQKGVYNKLWILFPWMRVSFSLSMVIEELGRLSYERHYQLDCILVVKLI